MTSQGTLTTIKPLGNRVLARRLASEEKIKGGIILPDSAKQKQETAEVIAIGPGIETKEGNILPVPVQVGDKILMDKYAGQQVTIDDQEYIIVKSEDIIAIVS